MSIINIKVTSNCNYDCGMCPFHGEGYGADYFQERIEWKSGLRAEGTLPSKRLSIVCER